MRQLILKFVVETLSGTLSAFIKVTRFVTRPQIEHFLISRPLFSTIISSLNFDGGNIFLLYLHTLVIFVNHRSSVAITQGSTHCVKIPLGKEVLLALGHKGEDFSAPLPPLHFRSTFAAQVPSPRGTES